MKHVFGFNLTTLTSLCYVPLSRGYYTPVATPNLLVSEGVFIANHFTFLERSDEIRMARIACNLAAIFEVFDFSELVCAWTGGLRHCADFDYS